MYKKKYTAMTLSERNETCLSLYVYTKIYRGRERNENYQPTQRDDHYDGNYLNTNKTDTRRLFTQKNYRQDCR